MPIHRIIRFSRAQLRNYHMTLDNPEVYVCNNHHLIMTVNGTVFCNMKLKN